jgi:hypothetical protein
MSRPPGLLLSDETKEKIRQGVKSARSKEKPVVGGGDKAASPGSGDPGGGSVDGSNNGPVLPGGPTAGGSGGGPAVPPHATPPIGNKISTQQPTHVININEDRFFTGLPFFFKLCFRAASKCIGLLTFFLPFKIEIEDLTTEESEFLTNTVKPGIKEFFPKWAKEFPLRLAIWGGAVALISKIKLTWKNRTAPNKPVAPAAAPPPPPPAPAPGKTEPQIQLHNPGGISDV